VAYRTTVVLTLAIMLDLELRILNRFAAFIQRESYIQWLGEYNPS